MQLLSTLGSPESASVLQRGQAAPDLTSYFWVCGGLLAALGLGALLVRRLFARSFEARAARRSLRVVDVLPLGGRKRLAVVTCYDRTFVLGLGEREVALVAEIEREASGAGTSAGRAAEPLAPVAPANAFGRRLADVLRPALRPAPGEPEPVAPPPELARRMRGEGVLG